MVKKRLRLKQSKDFQRLRQDGRVIRHPSLLLSFAPNDKTHNRYGFITVKRLGNAVTRNRIRRLLREAVRLAHPRLPQGYDMVFVAHQGLVSQPFHAVQRIVNDLFARAGFNGQGESEHP